MKIQNFGNVSRLAEREVPGNGLCLAIAGERADNVENNGVEGSVYMRQIVDEILANRSEKKENWI